MRRQSSQTSTALKLIALALVLSPMGVSLGSRPAYAGQEASDVAYVEDVSGRVLSFSQGKPTLLEALDTIDDQTQLDLLANSELRICHYQTHQLLTLNGPLRAFVSRNGVTIENRKAVLASVGSCAAPVVSTLPGGFLSRSLKTITVNDVSEK